MQRTKTWRPCRLKAAGRALTSTPRVNDRRRAVAEMTHQVLGDPSMPLAGLNVLMRELSITATGGRWTHLVDTTRLGGLLARCWEDSDRGGAAFLLSTLSAYIPGWPRTILGDHVVRLAGWINDPVPSAGYATLRSA
jgi:hypothetical protein